MKLLVRQRKVTPSLSDKVRVVVYGFAKDNGSVPAVSKTVSFTQTSVKEVVRLLKAHCGQEE